MSIEKLSLLEEKVFKILEIFKSLKKEKEELEKKLLEKDEEIKKLKEEKVVIVSKIENMLKSLEEVEF